MMNSKIRLPCVAGQFYYAQPSSLKSQIESHIDKNAAKVDVLGCVLPHAGYMYSGEVAAQTVCRINIKDKIILLGPNHTGLGRAFSIMTGGTWQTPLGEIKIDSNLAGRILSNSKYLEDEPEAHAHEHSLEVELPILQYFKSDFEIVPIVILSDNIASLKAIGSDIAKVIKDSGIKDSTMIVASSDMTHYEPEAYAREKDKQAIEAILELDEDKLMEKIKRFDISMCGYAPVITMLTAVKQLGAKTAKLILYQTSADATGDKTSVVGYAGIIVQ